ncbi:energy transducer TonB [Parvicella tangerina]|uniref:TonB C-terminal domain-containing protein n=1 Tax=Parvicella tangerina TaxID=2829795 RepID=A0A916JNP0_9FLAO|nr:TonB family protein [Parvicella tangerina]CAG5082463.1 hypothetical protein CRYO30217_01924 [Parvicella tangerina]
MRYLVLFLLGVCTSYHWSQTNTHYSADSFPTPPPVHLNNYPENEVTSDHILMDPIELAPAFPGGQKAMYSFLSDHLVIPAYIIENGLQGKLYVQFTIDSTGDIKDVSVLKSFHQVMDAEIIRVIEMMPCWKPGQIGLEKVDMKFTLPITVSLN